MSILTNWLVNTLVIMVAAYLLPGVHVENYLTALVLALVMGILNTLVRPLLIMLTLPITIVTFGLFLFFVNALMVIIASHVVPGFSVDGFFSAFLFSILIAIINIILRKI